MRAVVQLVDSAEVYVDGQMTGKCGKGFLIYVGIHKDDEDSDAVRLADRVAKLRICPDNDGRLTLGLEAYSEPEKAAALVISNFTLYGDAWAGRRPSYSRAAGQDQGSRLFDLFLGELRGFDIRAESGTFGADMMVKSNAAGPVNLVIDSR